MAYNTKIAELQDKIKKLEDAKLQLEATRNQEIAAIITKLGLSSVDDDVLVGGLLYFKDLLKSDENKQEEWRIAGRKFLGKKQLVKK